MRSKFLIERKLKELKDEYNSSIKSASLSELRTMLIQIETLEWVLEKEKE